jgi:hypothetical protein
MLRGILVSLLAVFIIGCSLLSHEAPLEDVDKAGVLFFQRFEQGDYDTIYKDAAKGLKDNKTKQTVVDNLKQIAEAGTLAQYQRISTSIQAEGKDRMASPVYMLLFEKAKGELTLNFLDESGEWKLIGFAFKPHQ